MRKNTFKLSKLLQPMIAFLLCSWAVMAIGATDQPREGFGGLSAVIAKKNHEAEMFLPVFLLTGGMILFYLVAFFLMQFWINSRKKSSGIHTDGSMNK